MSAITIDIKKGEKALENLTVSIDGNSIGDLLASLKTAKNDSNAFLTTLVNQEKGMKNRKHEEIESSDDDTQKDTNKKPKT